MTTSTQTQLRRGTSSQCAAMTPAAGEPIVNTTDKRIHIGDGSTAGGIVLPNAADIQAQKFIYPTVGGTGNAITFTNVVPVIALVAGLCFEWKCTNANTLGPTIAVDGLTAKNEYKVAAGSLTAKASGDNIVGVIYRSRYDGTQFQTQPWDAAIPSGFPPEQVGSFSGTSFGLTVDFTTYSSYALYFNKARTGSLDGLVIDVSSDGGSTLASPSRSGRAFTASAVTTSPSNELDINNSDSVLMGTLFQPVTSSDATLIYEGEGNGKFRLAKTTYTLTAAINKIIISSFSGASFTAGSYILQPLTKR